MQWLSWWCLLLKLAFVCFTVIIGIVIIIIIIVVYFFFVVSIRSNDIIIIIIVFFFFFFVNIIGFFFIIIIVTTNFIIILIVVQKWVMVHQYQHHNCRCHYHFSLGSKSVIFWQRFIRQSLMIPSTVINVSFQLK